MTAVRRPARLLAVGLATAALTLLSSSAWAWWSGPSTSQVTRGVGAAPALIVGATSLSGTLAPGLTRDLTVTLTNLGTAPVTVTTIGGSVASTTVGGCPTSAVTVGSASPSGLVVPAGGSATTTLTGLVSMLASAADACQGVGVTLTLAVSGRL